MLGVPASILLGNAGRRPPAAFPRQRGDGRVDRDLPGGIFENFRADDTANGPGQPCSQPSHFGAGVLPFTGRRGGIVALSAVVCSSRTNREWRRFSTISITVSVLETPVVSDFPYHSGFDNRPSAHHGGA